jgi:Na+/melibiose symporter-like transporter
MIFTLSSTISLKKKILYLGLMALVVSSLLISMVDKGDPRKMEFLQWISPVLVAGISTIVLVIVQRDTQYMYSQWGRFVPLLVCLFIPLVITIFLYFLSILISIENLGQKYLLENAGKVMVVNMPVIVVFYLLLNRECRT